MSTLHTLTRRPWYQIRVGVGQAGDPRGRVWWAQTEDRARRELKRRLDEAVAWGARDVLIDSPMGRLPTSFVSGASWGPMQLWEKNMWAWATRAYPELRFHVFMGSTIRGYTSIVGETPATKQHFALFFDDATDAYPRVYAEMTIKGWRNIGVHSFVLDHSGHASKYPHYVAQAERLRNEGVLITGEAIPTDGPQAVRAEAMAAMPWMATHDVIDSTWPNTTWDPEKTRVLCWYHWTPRRLWPAFFRAAIVRKKIEQGYVIVTDDRAMFATAMAHFEKAGG
jgi:hypothetical protein